jgi:hypothetical protein
MSTHEVRRMDMNTCSQRPDCCCPPEECEHPEIWLADALAKVERERDRLRRVGEFLRDSIGECHMMISRNTPEYQLRTEWEPSDLPPRLQKIMRERDEWRARWDEQGNALAVRIAALAGDDRATWCPFCLPWPARDERGRMPPVKTCSTHEDHRRLLVDGQKVADQLTIAERERDTAQQRAEALAGALEKYGWHTGNCPRFCDSDAACSCGYDGLDAALRAATPDAGAGA